MTTAGSTLSRKTTRERIIEVADRLFYEQGFEHTSFSDVANAVNISRGNFYHHFKSKDDILDAVITLRMARTRAMLDGWEAHGDGPAERIRGFIQMLLINRADIRRHGCPVGTLCTELSKLSHPAHTRANALFTAFRSWLQQQFAQLVPRRDADRLAMHLLGRSQGIAVLAQAMDDEAFVKHEVQQLHDWLDAVCMQAGGARPPP